MPVSFTRLRIAGFKSFPEVASLEVLPGLTGIVGPNGCGKSNVVEALRWAMGEASARSMRGGEMDDVIFAGTANRASRNIAEVTIRLEETQGLAPPPFHEAPELEIARRIERGAGSTFRINGREARARDVQTLFADLATGARSSAMVSQGRVGAIVNARPDERRAILEEAAGITGLHARRHEAELKLRATEANLDRAEDIRRQQEGQLEGLRRQAKQAARFRVLAESVREAEAELLSVQRARATQAREAATAALAAAEAAVAEATGAVTEASARTASAAAELPTLRAEEAEARTALERARLAAHEAGAEAARATAALAEAARRCEQVARDLAHAEQVGRDAASARARLTEEQTRLAAEAAAAPAILAAAEAETARAVAALHAAEAEAQGATEHAADAIARHRAAGEALAAAEQRAARVRGQLAQERDEVARLAAQAVPEAELTAAVARRADAEAAAVDARARMDAADQARTAAQAAAAAARDHATATGANRTRLAAAVQGLREALTVRPGAKGPGIVDAISAPAGLETALGAALEEDLEAPTADTAHRHWHALPPFEDAPALPAEAKPFSELIDAPPALARALSQVGLIEGEQPGAETQSLLRPGQMLVSRAGAVWRADGFRVRAGAPTPAAIRLQQRNRLAALAEELAAAERIAAEATAARDVALAAERTATQADAEARAAAREAERKLAEAREYAARIERHSASIAAQLAAAIEARGRAEAEWAEADALATQARAALDAAPDPAAARARAEQARAAVVQARAVDARTRGNWDSLRRADEARTRRLAAVGAELDDWKLREADAQGRLLDLTARRDDVQREHAARLGDPERLAARREEATASVHAAEAAARRAADRLAHAERTTADTERALRAAESALAEARETRVRREGEAARADATWGVVAERLLERLGVDPVLPDPPPVLDEAAEEKPRRRLERLVREREGMGPVNMRAEIEAAEVETRVATVLHEVEELTAAIAKLRGSIGHINREGRERLGQVFADIDRHFRALFEAMFGGGRAHLALVGSEDPLQAGLEIYAQPPGKKLATLSLLSGGEQALTALSLVFAVFRCNPAPVCVLDEVDAPLDDANVERFCGLLEAMVRETGTRFLVVTHHQLTMARMNRLYGVTMQERGVSRLLSVDLSRATELAETPRMAAE